jgi:hypothetical protein
MCELFFRAMQDGDEVDHHIVAADQGLQLFSVVHVGLYHRYARHHLNMASRQAARGHRHLVVLQT